MIPSTRYNELVYDLTKAGIKALQDHDMYHPHNGMSLGPWWHGRMLSELRKYRVGLVLAAQFCPQIKTSIIDAIFGNVGTLTVFRIGAQDAPIMSRQLGEVHPADLVNLPNYRNFTKLMINEVQTKAFSAQTSIK